MTATNASRAATLLIGGLLVLAGYLLGVSQRPAWSQDRPAENAANDDAPAAAPTAVIGAIGVSIPPSGAALVRGADGNAYVVDSRGLFVRASQSGKPLPLK